MKKVLFLSVAVMIIALSSCEVKDDVAQPSTPSQYVASIEGEFMAKDRDVTLKSAPVGLNRIWTVYKKVGGVFSLVDGSEFITGSAAYNDWHNGLNPVTFSVSQALYITYCPVMDLRVTTQTLNSSGQVAYIGIHDFFPNAANFPITITGRRMGDVLKINMDSLQNIPGYNFQVSVTYNLSTIDIAATTLGATTTDVAWPTLLYTAAVNVPATAAITGPSDFTVYDGLDKKVVGNIVLNITDPGNNINITKTVPAEGFGYGLVLVLKTNKAGYYHSASPILIEDKDIVIIRKPIIIEDNN